MFQPDYEIVNQNSNISCKSREIMVSLNISWRVREIMVGLIISLRMGEIVVGLIISLGVREIIEDLNISLGVIEPCFQHFEDWDCTASVEYRKKPESFSDEEEQKEIITKIKTMFGPEEIEIESEDDTKSNVKIKDLICLFP